MLTQLGAGLVGLFDSIMVGRYATTDLAAVSFSNAIFFTFMVFAMGALMGLTPLVGVEVGRAQAEDDWHRADAPISALLQNGVVFTILLSLMMLLCLGGIIPWLNHFGQDPDVVRTARPYYILIVLSIVPYLFFCLFKQFLEGLGNTIVAMVITLVMNGLNIFLNWVLVFGRLGAPELGAEGAGWATLIARLLMPICFAVVILAYRPWRVYVTHFARRFFSWQQVGRLFRIGAPIGGQTWLETIAFTVSFVLIGWISKEALAAHQIANQIADQTFMLALGIGAATTIRVSHQLGRGDLCALRMAANASVHLVLLMNTIGASLMIGLRHQIPLLFTHDPEVISIAAKLILFAGLFQYADGLQCVGAAMLRGITDVRRPMYYAFVAYMLIALPVGIVCMFPLKMGAPGMWIGFILGLAAAAVLFHARFIRLYSRMTMPSTGKDC